MNLDEDKVHHLQQSIIKQLRETNLHIRPSPQTEEWHKNNLEWQKKMNENNKELRNDIKNLEINMARYEEKVDTIKENVDEIYNKIDNFIECADKKYILKSEQKILNESVSSFIKNSNDIFASKLTQTIVYNGAKIILLAFFSYLVYSSFKKF